MISPFCRKDSSARTIPICHFRASRFTHEGGDDFCRHTASLIKSSFFNDGLERQRVDIGMIEHMMLTRRRLDCGAVQINTQQEHN